MYTPAQTEQILKDIQKLLDDYHDSNDKKEKEKNEHLRNYANALRKACVEIGYIRYDLLV